VSFQDFARKPLWFKILRRVSFVFNILRGTREDPRTWPGRMQLLPPAKGRLESVGPEVHTLA
jgi:hypothetical protein